jgi:NADH-quinone oxidoreductase subunit H
VVIAAIVVSLFVITFVLTKWMKKHYNWKDEKDSRSKENAILIKAFWILTLVTSAILISFIVTGLGTNGVNIATAVIQIGTFLIKFFMMSLVFIWVRWTLLRFRYDQLQMLGWKVLLPLALLNIFITATFVVVVGS